MVNVAVAGGSGGLGRHIVEALLRTRQHHVIVLSRRNVASSLFPPEVQVKQISYDDCTSLIEALNGVHTVISAINGVDPHSVVHTQLALLDAAVKAGVKRFAPSEFATAVDEDHPVDLYKMKRVVGDAVKKSGLEYTLFHNGVLMNYLASGTEGVGYMRHLKFVFDVENCRATIPGDGSAYFIFTRAEDVATFVAKSLDLPQWPAVSEMQGDRKMLNEVVQMAEAIRGMFLSFSYPTKLSKNLTKDNDLA